MRYEVIYIVALRSFKSWSLSNGLVDDWFHFFSCTRVVLTVENDTVVAKSNLHVRDGWIFLVKGFYAKHLQ